MFSRRRSVVGVAVVLGAAAVSLGLYAGTAAAKPPPPPPAACSSGTTCAWTGQGVPVEQQCSAAEDPNGVNQPYLLWIFTTGGQNISGGATLTLGGSGGASGSFAGTAHGHEFHFVTPYFTPSTSTLTAFVTYGGPTGNWNLVISHGCAGITDTTPPTCSLTSYTTYTNSTEKHSITVTLQDTGSGIQTVATTVTNATAVTSPPSPYTPPTTSPVTVTATKITQGLPATLEVVVTDASGNQTTCDPVLRKGRQVTSHPGGRQEDGATVRANGLTMHVSGSALTFGASSPLTLSGQVRNSPAGVPVTILSQAFGFMGLTPIATVATQADGTFSYRFHPAVGAFYAISANGRISPSLSVGVQPLVQLTRTASGHYRANVTTSNPLFLTGTKVLLQARHGNRWVTIAKTRLGKSSGVWEPTVVSSGTFVTRMGIGHLLRAVVHGTGSYMRGVSATVNG